MADRLGISLEAFRAKKVIQNKKKLKRPVVKNTTDRGSVVKNTTPEICKAEKSFASLVICGGVANDDIELIEFDKDELALIFEEKYARLSKSELENEAKALEIVLHKERAEAKRNELGEQIRAAEAAGDEEKMLQLMAEMNKIIRKS